MNRLVLLFSLIAAIQAQSFYSFTTSGIFDSVSQKIHWDQPNITANFYFSSSRSRSQVNISLIEYDVFQKFPKLSTWGFSKIQKDSVDLNLALTWSSNFSTGDFASWGGSFENLDNSVVVSLYQRTENDEPYLAGFNSDITLSNADWNGIWTFVQFNSSAPGSVFLLPYNAFIEVKRGRHIHLPHFDFIVDTPETTSVSFTPQGNDFGVTRKIPNGYSALGYYLFVVGDINGTLIFDLQTLFAGSQLDINQIRLFKLDMLGGGSTILPPVPSGGKLTYTGGDFQIKPHILITPQAVTIGSSGNIVVSGKSNDCSVLFASYLLMSIVVSILM